jgi:hypothetical protein
MSGKLDFEQIAYRRVQDQRAYRGIKVRGRRLSGQLSLVDPSPADLARIIHEGPTAAVHLRALAEEIGVRLLDVG